MSPFKTAVVTGASGGIGSAIVRALSDLDFGVCLVGRTEAALRATVASTAAQDRHLVVRVELTDSDAEDVIMDAVISTYGRLDVVVHVAGEFSTSLIEDSVLEELDALYRCNIRAPYALTRAALPLLTTSKGQVVFINSSVVQNPKTAVAQYAITRHALLGLADCLREEVNHKGIRVVSVFPGRTATSLQKRISAISGRDYEPAKLLQPEDVAMSVVHAITVPRSAEVTNVFIRPMKKT